MSVLRSPVSRQPLSRLNVYAGIVAEKWKMDRGCPEVRTYIPKQAGEITWVLVVSEFCHRERKLQCWVFEKKLPKVVFIPTEIIRLGEWPISIPLVVVYRH